MASKSTINGNSMSGSYYGTSSSNASKGITVVGRTKTYKTYQEMLDDVQPGSYAYVIDASGDPTVDSGFAYYRYEEGVWNKLFEEEMMDTTIGHSHTNMEVLNQFGIKDRRPTFGTDYLVRQSEMDQAIAKAVIWITKPDDADPNEIPFITRSEFEKVSNKLKYTFITSEDLVTLEERTYIVRDVKLTAQLPDGSLLPDDVAIRVIVNAASAAQGGAIVPVLSDSINGSSLFNITSAMDVTLVYDKANKDWVVIGTIM